MEGRIPLRDQLDMLSSELRAGTIDSILAAYISRRDHLSLTEISSLLFFLAQERRYAAPPPLHLSAHRSSQETNSPPDVEFPNRNITEYLSRLGLAEQIFAYFSRFPGPFPEETVLVCERSQLNPYDAFSNHFRREGGLRAQEKLNYFRLAQRVRNEHGVTRMSSPSSSFNSFEDIIESERKIEQGDTVDFMLKSVEANLVAPRHLISMYHSTTCYLQLEALHEGVTRLRGRSMGEIDRLFAEKFESLLVNWSGPSPKWPQVKKYLKATDYLESGSDKIINVEIPDEELDEAVCCLLNCLVRVFLSHGMVHLHRFVGIDRALTPEAIQMLKRLLDRGANLLFKDPGEELFSLSALLKLAQISLCQFPLSEFSPYICCPLTYEDRVIRFDKFRPAPLSCLAAKAVCPSENARRLPGTLCSFVERHHELELQLAEQ